MTLGEMLSAREKPGFAPVSKKRKRNWWAYIFWALYAVGLYIGLLNVL
jgi:hypothetical protein